MEKETVGVKDFIYPIYLRLIEVSCIDQGY